ncbi:hypothetical protein WKW79_34840 [Variovorax robiniae]|uniref:Uncharacterized protein n=1 Tax=Variovorax robiniae TaxID=1836199 RepID=A0ABU8XL05_9BURK
MVALQPLIPVHERARNPRLKDERWSGGREFTNGTSFMPANTPADMAALPVDVAVRDRTCAAQSLLARGAHGLAITDADTLISRDWLPD